MYYMIHGDTYSLAQDFMWYRGYITPLGFNHAVEFLNELTSKLNKTQSVIMAICGPPGTGKTYWAMALGEMYDDEFDIDIHVCFSREDILNIISGKVKVDYKQAIVIDEAHIAAGARSWGKAEQQDLVNLIATMRNRGLLIFIVVLNISMLDSILRKYTMNYMVNMIMPGLGKAYAITNSIFIDKQYWNKKDPMRLPLPGEEHCDWDNCLQCENFEECFVSRARYERRKRDYIASLSEDSTVRIEKINQKKVTNIEYAKMLYEHKEELNLNNRGNIDYLSIVMILEDMDKPVGRSTATALARRLERTYPNLVAELGAAELSHDDREAAVL